MSASAFAHKWQTRRPPSAARSAQYRAAVRLIGLSGHVMGHGFTPDQQELLDHAASDLDILGRS